jgi:hypothetical protein
VNAPTCVRCGRPMADSAYACTAETTRAAELLGQIGDMLPAARDVAHGLSRRAGGSATGKPGSRLPFDLGATSRLDTVQVALTAHVDHIGTTRGIPRPWFTDHEDPIAAAARWLTDHLEWMRHHEDADRFLADIDVCARIVAGIARGPASQKYLGPCGAQIEAFGDDSPLRSGWIECDGDVYARETASVGRCRDCGAEVSTDARRAWLDAEVRSRAFRAVEISRAYNINIKTIRSWINRGQLIAHGEGLYNVGDVLDLAAADAARKASDQARRARRATRRDTAA